MCILFFIVGNESSPTLLCNNRDEYFVRATSRGRFTRPNGDEIVDIGDNSGDPEVVYAPIDLEGGGTWIGFSQLHHNMNQLRFAVVLNLDSTSVASHLLTLTSRGKLVRDFIASPHISAQVFAEEVYSERLKYRPFNLLLSDGCGGAYYINNGDPCLEGPQKLDLTTLYGISNGCLHEIWDKTEAGKAQLHSLLEGNRLRNILSTLPLDHPSTEPIDTLRIKQLGFQALESELAERSLFPDSPEVDKLLRDLLEVMTDRTPRKDNLTGMEVPGMVNLASIFALPTIVTPYGSAPEPSRYHVITDHMSCSTPNPLLRRVFGTRTITLLVHYSAQYQQQQRQLFDQEHGDGLFILLEDDLQYPSYGPSSDDGSQRCALPVHDLHLFHNLPICNNNSK